MAQNKRKSKPTKGDGQRLFYIVLGVIAVAGVAAILYAVRGGGGGSTATEPVALEITDARELYDRATPKRIGEDAAPMKVVVFSDFRCPGCAAFALGQLPNIMPFIERGEAQYISYDFILGSFPHSFLAARAARCAGDQPADGTVDGTGYWPYHDVLYQRQATWPMQRNIEGELVGMAGEVGLDERAFGQCLRSDRHAEAVTANRMVGDQLGVRSTPTVLVNNRRVTGRTIQDMGSEVVRMLREASAGQEAAAAQ